ncbi:DNA-binding protein WhiA [Mycoplasmopsis ciconiae]|uniref:DNA-binding protein WhiA n=1 Tax=Mycoplasmopsis ciconiae TaxID=561067 RepID=A0ABU7MLU6_9BACT|nr:DNA-binding protein WhiA [Mycoplasmopsis ciconiae]
MDKTNENISFSKQIKLEVLENQKLPKYIKSFLNGFILSNAKVENQTYIINIKYQPIRDYIISFLQKLRISFEHKNTIIKINMDNFKIKEQIDHPSNFFAGVFCGGGNLSTKNSTSYHLEISSYYIVNLQFMIEKLNQYNFNFSIIKRRQRYIAYIKKTELLVDFLAAIEAKNAYFELQDIKIKRDIENSINRVNNIDFSNLTRVAQSSINHIKLINYMFENNLEKYFNQEQLVFFRLKSEFPELTLNEIKAILQSEHNIFITKGGLNHWIIKLKKVIKQHLNETKDIVE